MREEDIPEDVEDAEEDDVEVDFITELASMLAEGSCAILMEAGSEKARYITGHAIAITCDGVIEQVSLSDIYRLLEDKHQGLSFTAAEY